MSRSIFIQSSTGLEASDGDVNNPEAVADGKVVLLGIDGEGQVGLGGTDAPNRFQIVRGTPDAGEPARRSGIIQKSKIRGATFEAYRAPVAQVTTVTPTAGSVADGTAGLKITRLDQGYEQYPRTNYEIEVAAGDSATDICNKLRAAIDAAKASQSTINNTLRHIVVASGTATLILTAIEPPLHTGGTAKQEWISFSTQLYGEAVGGWTIASTASPDPGSGSYGQVYEFEDRSFGNMGFYYSEHYPQRPAHHATAGTNYDLLTLEVETNASPEINKSFEVHQHVIAVVAGQMDEATVLGLFGIEADESPSPS